MWFSYFQEADGIIDWLKIQDQRVIETTVHQFKLGPFQLSVPAESYVIFEYLQGSEVHHNVTASYIFLFVIVFCAMVLFAVISTLGRFWYFLAMGLFILFVVSMRLDVLMLFGHRGILTPVFVLAAFLGVNYFFKSIRPQTNFAVRLIVFLLMSAAIWVLSLFYAEVPYPTLHLALTAYTPALILSILFMIMVAHEIMAAFVFVASQGASKSLRHFSLISVIYLVNIFITCLHEMGTISWNFIYINVYMLLCISAILGLWGFKQREVRYGNIIPFSPFGAFFFIAFGAICFVTIGQLLGNANDAALKVVRDLIIFSHTGFGLIFLAYIFSNYMVMMAENIPVHKVLYNPTRMPYFTFRFAGLIVTIAFVLVSHWEDYLSHSRAGFYNYAADLYQMQGNETFAQAFYERSKRNAFQNHRGNYALAMIKASRFDFEGADENFELANGKRPSDYSLVNRGNLHLWLTQYFPALGVFREAEKVRDSPALANNLGFTYSKIHNLDSALYYLNKARQDGVTKNTAEANFFALAAAEILPLKTDSILKVFNTSDPAVISNAMALATLFKEDIDPALDPLNVKQLDLYTATLLNNYIIKNARSLDTTVTRKIFEIADDSVNVPFSEAVKASLAYAYYHQGNVYKAQELLGELVFRTHSYQGKYNYVMGLWALEQGSPRVAESYFRHAVLGEYKNAILYNAIALTEAQKTDEALVAWDSVISKGDEGETRMAGRVKRILTTSPAEALKLPDAEKYQFARYVVSIDDTVYFSRLSNTFDNANYKAQALLDMSKKQFAAGRTVRAIRFFNQTSGLELTDRGLYDEIRHFELIMLASRREIRTLATQINNNITFDASRTLEKMLYTALVSEMSNDTATAEKNYKILGSWNPYFEDGILAAAAFYRKQYPESDKAYTILVEAIQINATSRRLLAAYAEEAARQGFDEYAASALERLSQLR
jgi:tetratricopeptide (TPR) repeat protein